MLRFVVLARSTTTAAAIKSVLQATAAADDDSIQVIVRGNTGESDPAGIGEYHRIAGELHDACSRSSASNWLGSVTAFVDLVRPTSLNAISARGDWDNLIAMLVLTFPELNWRFGALRGPKEADFKEIAVQHTVFQPLGFGQRDQLFDPTGLRNYIRLRTNEALKAAKDKLHLPTRPANAAGIDEERPFAYWHAYCAYRFGYCSDVVTTFAGMMARFPAAEPAHRYALLFEDMSLNFPDASAKLELADLDERAKTFPTLNSLDPNRETSKSRILVTGGRPDGEDATVAKNEAHLRVKKPHAHGDVIFKPTGGMYDFWIRAELMKRPNEIVRALQTFFWGTPATSREAFAKDFDWPPPAPDRWRMRLLRFTRSIRQWLVKRGWVKERPKPRPQHGAPGKLQLIAERMIQRARQIRSAPADYQSLVLGATWSTDALELIGAKTPTTALDALRLKHEFELAYECQFSGAEYHIDVRSRVAEISAETWHLAQWLDPDNTERANANAKMRILSGMVAVLRDGMQFDEERFCLAQIRHLHFTQWLESLHPPRWLDAFSLPVFLVRFVCIDLPLRYLEWLFRSFAWFLFWLAVWVVALSLGYQWAFDAPGDWKTWADGFITFFSAGGPVANQAMGDHPERVALINAIAVFSGAIHMGVFISYLFTVMSRR